MKLLFHIFFGIVWLGLNSISASAQNKLSLNEAIKIALVTNYELKISQNDFLISENNVSLSNAGILPRLDFNVSDNNSVLNTKQELSNGITQESSNARNTNLAYGPVVSWRIFDGFGMFARYHQLEEFEKLGEQNFRISIQNTIAQLSSSYFNIIQQNKQIEALNAAIEISKIRLKNSQSRFEIGRASKLEVLAAKVDLNTDTTNLLRQQNQLKATKILLNQLLARNPETEFTVEDTIIVDKNLQLLDLQTSSQAQNPALLAAIANEQVAIFNRSQIRAARYPQVNVSSGYNLSRSTSDLGFARVSQARGLNYGFTATIPLFNGLLQKRNEKNATINLESAKIDRERIKLAVSSQISIEYQTYTTNKELVALEEKNIEIARQNLQVSFDKFNLGSIAPLELREAQRNFVEASTRFSEAQFNLKQSEINLMQLSGLLLVENKIPMNEN